MLSDISINNSMMQNYDAFLKCKVVVLFGKMDFFYTRQKKKVSIPLWRSLKDLISNVHNSN